MARNYFIIRLRFIKHVVHIIFKPFLVDNDVWCLRLSILDLALFHLGGANAVYHLVELILVLNVYENYQRHLEVVDYYVA